MRAEGEPEGGGWVDDVLATHQPFDARRRRHLEPQHGRVRRAHARPQALGHAARADAAALVFDEDGLRRVEARPLQGQHVLVVTWLGLGLGLGSGLG